jgi:hypothetical protein
LEEQEYFRITSCVFFLGQSENPHAWKHTEVLRRERETSCSGRLLVFWNTAEHTIALTKMGFGKREESW